MRRDIPQHADSQDGDDRNGRTGVGGERQATICQPIAYPSSEGVARPFTDKIPLFGPYYRRCPVLQGAIDHAERAHRVLREANEEMAEARSWLDRYVMSAAEEHLMTRADELHAFTASFAEDFLLGRTPGEIAAVSIEDYIRERVHEFLREEFEHPTCCADPSRISTLTCRVDPAISAATRSGRLETVAYTMLPRSEGYTTSPRSEGSPSPSPQSGLPLLPPGSRRG